MTSESALRQATRLAGHVTALLSQQDIDSYDKHEQKLIAAIKREVGDARLDVRDYEMADSRTELVSTGRAAISRLEQVRTLILKASEYTIFSAIEVAEITTGIEGLISEIRSSTT